jgi:hypothetical protein
VPFRFEEIEERLPDLRRRHHVKTNEKFNENWGGVRVEVFGR